MPSERVQRQIDQLLTEAEQAIRDLDWATVSARAEAALSLDRENGDAQAYLAAAEEKLRAGANPPPTAALAGPRPSTGSETPVPASFANDRYQVKRFLGEGGKKRVYLAHDTMLDRDVAFALIKIEGLDAEGRERISREAQAMGKLGTHPHIVTVHDIGDEAGQPYLVTELMAGGDVESQLGKAEEHRLPIERAVELAGQVCRGLGFAHEHGLVHRDLKPGNVWLTADGTVKIGDFGLAVSLDRSRLTQAGMMVGTVSYMPPEQATGGEITPRSDLYSLGAMLYEMVCGRPPFIGDDSVAIIGQHLNTPPVSPSWHRPDCPAGLEALILRMLEKDSGKRPASASEVRQALEGVQGADPHPGPLPPGRGDAPDGGAGGVGDDPLYRRTFVGRENELRQLHAAFDAALSGRGSLVMVVGEPGIGKTSVCEQLATYATLRGGKALVGHCYEEGSLSLPYLPFVEALRSYVLQRDPDGLKSDLGSGAGDVARIVSEVRDRVPIDQRPGGDAEEERYRLLQAVTSFLRNASQVQALLLVLEDLHDADRGTLDLLVNVARNLEGARLVIVGTYRDVEVDRSHPLSNTLADLRRTGSFLRVPLRGLTVDEVHRMMAAIRGQEVPWARAEAIHRQTEGNPLFIQEVLRYLVEEGLVVREGNRYTRTGEGPADEGIPEGLRDVIGKRLSRLGESANQVLSVASVIGRDFGMEVLRRVAGLPDDQLEAALEEATDRAVIEQRQAVGAVGFRFTHAFFRQALYEEIFIPRRIRWHQQVARALEQVYARRLEEHAAELAEHFAQSTEEEDLRKALEYSELAARRAMGVYAYGEAERHLQQALKVQDVLEPQDQTKRCDLLMDLADAMLPGENPVRVARGPATEAFAIAKECGDGERAGHAAVLALDAFMRMATTASAMYETSEFQEWAERADVYTKEGTPARVYADVYQGAAYISVRGPAAGHVYLRRAVEQAARIDDNRAFFVAAGWAFNRLHALQDRPTKGALVHEFLRRSRTGARSRDVAQCLVDAGFFLLQEGDREQAEKQWAELGQLSVVTRDATIRALALRPPGYLAFLDGHLGEALARDEEMERRAADLGLTTPVLDPWARGSIYLGHGENALERLTARDRSTQADRAVCLAHLGRHSEARSIIEERFQGITSDDDESGLHNIANLLEAAVLMGDRELATGLARRLAPLASQPVGNFRLVSHPRLLGGAARLLGDYEQARSYYLQAIEVCSKIRFRPEVALAHLDLAELLLDPSTGPSGASGPRSGNGREEQAEAQQHLDFAIAELREMKMQPALERTLKHKGLLHA